MKDQESVTLWSIKQSKHEVENIIPAWAMESDTERSRPVALAGDRCGLEQCLFGIELIKAHSRSNTAPITLSACCGRKGCYSGSLCFQAAKCSWGHAVMVVCVSSEKCHWWKGIIVIMFLALSLKASLVVVHLWVFVNRGGIGMVGVGWLTSSSRNLSEALERFS